MLADFSMIWSSSFEKKLGGKSLPNTSFPRQISIRWRNVRIDWITTVRSFISWGMFSAERKSWRAWARTGWAQQYFTFSGPFQHFVVRPAHETYWDARWAIAAWTSGSSGVSIKDFTSAWNRVTNGAKSSLYSWPLFSPFIGADVTR